MTSDYHQSTLPRMRHQIITLASGETDGNLRHWLERGVVAAWNKEEKIRCWAHARASFHINLGRASLRDARPFRTSSNKLFVFSLSFFFFYFLKCQDKNSSWFIPTRCKMLWGARTHRSTCEMTKSAFLSEARQAWNQALTCATLNSWRTSKSLKLHMLISDGKGMKWKRKIQYIYIYFLFPVSQADSELLGCRPENPSWLPQVAQSPQREQSSPPGQEATGAERLPWPK